MTPDMVKKANYAEYKNSESVDILFLLPKKDRDTIEEFLRLFRGPFKVSQEHEYCESENKKPLKFKSLSDFLDFLVASNSAVQTIYWVFIGDRENREVKSIFVQFTSDNRLIGGLTVHGKLLGKYINEIETVYGVKTAIGPELCPPEDATEFDMWLETGTVIY